jgi:glycine/serine hydroxymethyltransferase
MGPEEMETVGKLIIRTVTNIGDEAVAKEVKDEVAKLTGRFPVPGITTDNAWPLQ